MTPILSALFLGCLQGITEFLPISSSGHLVLAQQVFHVQGPSLLLDVWLHFGTLLAIFAVLHRPILKLIDGAATCLKSGLSDPLHPLKQATGSSPRLLFLVILATIPTALIGLTFKDSFERLFEGNLRLIGAAFLFTAFLLFLTRTKKASPRKSGITPLHALAIGTIQGIAIIPGISRSGATIALALLLGIDRKEAGEFSFLIVIPAILGAMVLETLHAADMLRNPNFLGPALIGTGAAFAVGILALKALLRLVNHGSLYRFSYYCLGMGVLSLWIGR